MAGRFNIFQRTMLFWDELHPYNAVHVVRIPSPLESARLQHKLQTILEERGLTGLHIGPRARTFEFRGGPADVGLNIIPADEDPRSSLRTEIERQLNTRFDRSAEFTPFRFFAIADGASFWFGTAYFHAVADAESVMRFVLELVADYLGKDAAPVRQKWNPHRAARTGWRPGLWLRKLVALPSQVRALRSSARPDCTDENDFANGVETFVLGESELAKLTAAGKALSVTLNDVFLALLMRALSPPGSARRHARRTRMSLGCIVNTRREPGGDDPELFGLSLGSFSVTHDPAESLSLAGLAREISRQTRTLKRGGLYLANSLEMRFALLVMSLSSTAQRRRFYPKNWPLWGGITNMNLSKFREPLPSDSPADYFRAVSTGPATPLVLSITTFGERVNVAMSYRTAVYSKASVSIVRGRFVAAIGELPALP